MFQTEVQVGCLAGRLCSVPIAPRFATKHLTLMASGTKEFFPHKPFNLLLSGSFPCLAHLLKNNFRGHALEFLRRIFVVNAPKSQLLESKKGEIPAKNFGSFEKHRSQKPDVDQ